MSDNDPGSPSSSPSWEPPSGAPSEAPPYAPTWQPPSFDPSAAPPSYGQPAAGAPPQYGTLPPPPYGAPPPYGGPPQYGAMPAYGYQAYAPPRTEGSAVVALVAAGVSWVMCPVVAAIVALAVAPGARRKINESGGRLTGLGLVTAARWVAWLNIAFYVGIIGLAFVGAILGGVSDGGGSDFSSGVLPGR